MLRSVSFARLLAWLIPFPLPLILRSSAKCVKCTAAPPLPPLVGVKHVERVAYLQLWRLSSAQEIAL